MACERPIEHLGLVGGGRFPLRRDAIAHELTVRELAHAVQFADRSRFGCLFPEAVGWDAARVPPALRASGLTLIPCRHPGLVEAGFARVDEHRHEAIPSEDHAA
jgi:hypothetical protein